MKISFSSLYDNVGYQNTVIDIMHSRKEISEEKYEELQKSLYDLYHFNKVMVAKYGSGYVDID